MRYTKSLLLAATLLGALIQPLTASAAGCHLTGTAGAMTSTCIYTASRAGTYYALTPTFTITVRHLGLITLTITEADGPTGPIASGSGDRVTATLGNVACPVPDVQCIRALGTLDANDN